MPAPAIGVYVVAAIGTAAAGYVFKQFVYDPFIAPKVQRWVDEMKARQEVRRSSLRSRRKKPITPHGSSMRDGTSRHHDGNSGSLVELESMKSSTTRSGNGLGGESLLASGLLRSQIDSQAASTTNRRRGWAPAGDMSGSTEHVTYPVMAPTPAYTAVSPQLHGTSSPQPSLADSATFSVGSSDVESAAASIETLSANSPPLVASPRVVPEVTQIQPTSPRSPESFGSLDSPQIQLPTPISPPRSPSHLFPSPPSSPGPTSGLGLTIGPVSAPALHAPAMSFAESRSFSSLSFNTALSEQEDAFRSTDYNSTASSSQVFVDARSEASFSHHEDDDVMRPFHSGSQTLTRSLWNAGGNTNDVAGSPNLSRVSSGGEHEFDLLSDTFSDEGGSDGSWEEVAARRDGAVSPRR